MKVEDTKISEYLEGLEDKTSIPGGGGAAALAGAYGVALGRMAIAFTRGKKKYLEFEEELSFIDGRLSKLKHHFLELSNEDEQVFLPLSKAYGLPESTVEEQDYKEVTLEECLEKASLTPIKVMEKACEALNYMETLQRICAPLMKSDVAIGVQFLETALRGAVMNVYINTKMMKNKNRMMELNDYAGKLLLDGSDKARFVYETIESGLRPVYDRKQDFIDRNKVDFI